MAVSDAQVFDALYERFGVGDWEDGFSQKKWHEWRMTEIVKIKATRTKRRVDPGELLAAVRYCSVNGIDVRSHLGLYEHLRDARKWARVREDVEANRGLEQQIAAAIEHELEQPDSQWLDQFLRAAGDGRREVYEAWLHRGPAGT